MIRELKNMREKELERLLGTTIEIVEKIDAPYFTIHFTKEEKIEIFKSNHEPLTDTDIVVNDMYERVERFVKSKLENLPIHNVTIGLWYFPTEKPRKISYGRYMGKFMMGYHDENITQEQINILHSTGIIPIPVIARKEITEKEISLIKKYINGTYSDMFFLINFLKGVKYFGTPYTDMEGVIFKTQQKPYQIILYREEDAPQSTQSKMYRDVILKDFITWYFKTLPYITENVSYLNKITDLFVKYSQWTDVTNKYSMDKEDLVPPHTGFIGDVCYDKIPSDVAIVICRSDALMKGIYKILVNACKKELRKIEGDLLTQDDIVKFNRIVKEIKEA